MNVSTRTTSALLLALAMLVSWLLPLPAAAQTMFDRMLIAGDKQVVKGKDHRSRPFTPSSDGKPLWIVMHLLVEATGGDDGEVVWDVGFDAIPMQLTDTKALFRTRFMNPVRGLGGKDDEAAVLRVIESFFGAEEAARVKADRSILKRLRRAVVTKLVALDKAPPGQETFASVGLFRVDAARPLAMTVVVGQGEMPAEVRAWVDTAQGSWFYRYRIVVALIGMALLLGGVVWWRLLRRS
jgi:hypothetical protein